MAAIWPVDLPQVPLMEPYSETFPKTLIRTPMAAGPAKVRRLIGSNSRFVSIGMYLTAAQVVIFEEFLTTTLLGGSLHFTWLHPRTAAAIDCRIVVDENTAPTYKVITMDMIRVDFQMEILP